MSEHEFSADMTSLSEGGGSVDGLLGQAVREIQAMQAEPAVVAKAVVIEPRGKSGRVHIHIHGNGFGEDPGTVHLASSPRKPRPIVRWQNKKITIKGVAGEQYTEMVITKKDGTIAAIVNIPKTFSAGNGVPLAPNWTVTETEALEDGIHFRGTNLSFVETVMLKDDTFPTEEFVGNIVSKTDAELVVAWPPATEQDSALERACLVANLGYLQQEIVANDYDVDANVPGWPGWVQPASITGWSAVREASGDVVITIDGIGFDDNEGDVILTYNPSLSANIRAWDNFQIKVDGLPNTTYTDLQVLTADGRTAEKKITVEPTVTTPAELATLTSMSSPAINTIALEGTKLDQMAYMEVNSTSAGTFLVYNEARLPMAALYNLQNEVVVNTWDATDINITSANYGGESFNGAEAFDDIDVANVVISVPAFAVAGAPVVPAITSYTLTAPGEMTIAGVLLDQWDQFQLVWKIRRDSDGLQFGSGSLQAVRPGGNAVPTSGPQFLQDSLQDPVKSWSDTEIVLYMDAGTRINTGFYSSDFRELALNFVSPDRQNGSFVHDIQLPDGVDQKDTARGAVPEFLDDTIYAVGRNMFLGFSTGNHTMTANTPTQRVVAEFDQVLLPIDATDIKWLKVRVGNGQPFSAYVYQEGTDYHLWDDPTTPANRNAARGVTIVEWTAGKIELELPAGSFAAGETLYINDVHVPAKSFGGQISAVATSPVPAITGHSVNVGAQTVTISGSNLGSVEVTHNSSSGFADSTLTGPSSLPIQPLTAHGYGPHLDLVSQSSSQIVLSYAHAAQYFDAVAPIPFSQAQPQYTGVDLRSVNSPAGRLVSYQTLNLV